MRHALVLLAVSMLLTACAEPEDAGHLCDHDDFDTASLPLAQDGPWQPPEELLNRAAGYNIDSQQAGLWVGPDGCSGTFTDGARVLRDWVYDYWPQVPNIGGYSCRAIAGSSYMSVHGVGRALDIVIPLDGGQADNDLGDPLANYLLANAEEFGIQLIIWDRWIWSANGNPQSRPYTGQHPHHDHLHVEVNPAAARLDAPWFKGPMGPPELGGCDEPLARDGGVIDDSNSCFQAFGPAEYWRRVESEGLEGGLKWTNAFESEESSNWARWRINVGEEGLYRVEYSNHPEWFVFDSARYRVRAAGVEEEIFVDQGAETDAWVELGEYRFDAGGDQWVAVYDNSPLPVASEQHVGADAIRLTRVEGVAEPPAREDDLTEGDTTNKPAGELESDIDRPVTERDLDTSAAASVVGEGGCSSTGGGPLRPALFLAILGLFLVRRRR